MPHPSPTRSAFALLLPLSLLAGCGSDLAAPSPQKGTSFAAGPFTVDAGSEIVMCTYVNAENANEEDITELLGTQSVGGHHLIAYTIDHRVDLPPSPCSQGGQPGWAQLLATQLQSEKQVFPSGVGFHIKANQQFVLETHYINTDAAPLTVDSKLALTYAPVGTVTTRASTYFFGTTNIDIGPNSSGSKTVECAPPAAMSLHTIFGHEHRFGTGVTATFLPGGQSSGAQPLYATKEWDAPPIKVLEGGTMLGVGDKIRVTCDWNNTGNKRLRYPHEMCFAIGYYWPADSSLVCSSAGQKDACNCISQGKLDTGPGGATVEISLTRQAKISGSVGPLDTGAPIYCALFRAEDWVGIAPNPGAPPYYFRDAVDVPMKTTSDVVKFVVGDVTPGDYKVACVMDTIGGGFGAGKGDVLSSMAGKVSVAKGETGKVSMVLDYALP